MRAGDDIAGIIIRPGDTAHVIVIILTDQLVSTVVRVNQEGSVPFLYGQDITIIIVGISIGFVEAAKADGVGVHLGTGGGGRGRYVGKGLGQQRRAVDTDGLGGNSAVGIVGVGLGAATGGDGGDPVVIVIGIAGGTGDAVGGLRHSSEIILRVVGIAYTVAEIRTLFHILHQPVSKVVVVGGLDAGSGVCHGSQCAVVVVAVSYGVPILIGQPGDPAVGVVSIVYTIPVAVVNGGKVVIPVVGIGVARQGAAAKTGD